MTYKIPKYVEKVIAALNSKGFDAFVVGGAVRDLLLGKKPEDYDITTNARPDEIKMVGKAAGFDIVGDLGNNFGVVMFIVDKTKVEVASYRNETYGADAHRPEEVWYCQTLEEDLGRRDFTINAMALDNKGNIIDFYQGQEDLKNKVLKTVGNAAKRFDEDALRMFRACRFVAQLGFKADGNIAKGIKQNLERIEGLSLERVKVELDKLLVGPYVKEGLELLVSTGIASGRCQVKENGEKKAVPILPELEELIGVKQNPTYHLYDVWNHTLVAVSKGDRSLEVEWALLLHDIAKGKEGIRGVNASGEPCDHGHEELGAEMAENIMTRLRYPKEMVNLVAWLVKNHMRFGSNIAKGDEVTVKWLRKTAREGPFRTTKEMAEAFKKLVALCVADTAACNVHEEEIISAQMFGKKLIEAAYLMPVHSNDLLVNGETLLQVIKDKSELKEIIPLLLRRVQDGDILNTEADLLEAAKRWEKRKNS